MSVVNEQCKSVLQVIKQMFSYNLDYHVIPEEQQKILIGIIQ
jgi:hypothetical protein